MFVYQANAKAATIHDLVRRWPEIWHIRLENRRQTNVFFSFVARRTYLRFFIGIQGNDDTSIGVPDHLPEIIDCIDHRMLSYDELIHTMATLKASP